MSARDVSGTTIFIVDSVGEHRGMHYHNFPLASELSTLGLDVILLTTSETASHEYLPNNIEAWGVFIGIYGERTRWLRGFNYIQALIRIGWLCIKENPRIVHFHFFQIPWLDFILISIVNLMGICTVTSIHDILPLDFGGHISSTHGRAYFQIYKISSGLILHSQHAIDMLHQIDLTLSDKTIYIPLGSYYDFSERFERKRSIDSVSAKLHSHLASSDRPILIFGTIKPNKRLDWAIRALKIVHQNYPSAKLVIVGKPQDRDVTGDIALTQELGIADSVIWQTERVSDDELALYITAAEVVVFPYQWIYQSAATLMAMSFSKPVIATGVGGLLDIVHPGKTGMLVEPDDPPNMAQAIEFFLRYPEKASAMGRAGYEYVSQELSWQKIAQDTMDYYLHLITLNQSVSRAIK